MPIQKVLNQIVVKKDNNRVVYKIGNVDGYLNPADGKFYEEDTFETEIQGTGEFLYIDLGANITYRYDADTATYEKVVGIPLVYVDTLPSTGYIRSIVYGLRLEEKPGITISGWTELSQDEDFFSHLEVDDPTADPLTYSVKAGDRLQIFDSVNNTWEEIVKIHQTADDATINFEKTDGLMLIPTLPATLQWKVYGLTYYFGDQERQELTGLQSAIDVSYLTAQDIDDLMQSVAQTQWSYLAEVIVDTTISTKKVWSSNKVNEELGVTLEAAKEYTNEQVTKFKNTSYSLVSSTAEMVDRSKLYLLPIVGEDDNYEIYALVDDIPTPVGTTRVNLENYFTKEESDERYVQGTDVITKERFLREVGDITDLAPTFEATNVIDALNELSIFETTNIDFNNF